MKRRGIFIHIASLVLAISLLVSIIPLNATAADGSSETLALGVSNLTEFTNAMSNDSIGYIRILRDITTTKAAWEGANGEKTILGSNGAKLSLPSEGSVTLASDTTFKDLTLEILNRVIANGHKLIFDTGLSFFYENNQGFPFIVGGGYNQDCNSDTYIQVKSGNFLYSIVSGSYQAGLNGNCYVEIGGNAVINDIYGGGYGGGSYVDGSTTVIVTDQAVVNRNIYGGSATTSRQYGITGPVLIDISKDTQVIGTIFGTYSCGLQNGVTINIRDSAKINNLYGGPRGLGTYPEFDGGTIINLLDSCVVSGNVYGGGVNHSSITINGGTIITVSDDATVKGKIIGGNDYTGNIQEQNVFNGTKQIKLINKGSVDEFANIPAFEDIDVVEIENSHLDISLLNPDHTLGEIEVINSSLKIQKDKSFNSAVFLLQNSNLVMNAGNHFTAQRVDGNNIDVSILGVPQDTRITGSGISKDQFNSPVGYFSVQEENSIKMEPLTIQEISISKLPDKLKYSQNELLDLSGGLLKLTYQDKSSQTIDMTNSAITASYDFSTSGMKTVQLQYLEFTVDFDVEVSEKVLYLDSISVETMPDKALYNIGDVLDVSGGIIKLTYQDDSTALVPMIDPIFSYEYDFSTSGTKDVIVKYNSFSTSFEIEVQALSEGGGNVPGGTSSGKSSGGSSGGSTQADTVRTYESSIKTSVSLDEAKAAWDAAWKSQQSKAVIKLRFVNKASLPQNVLKSISDGANEKQVSVIIHADTVKDNTIISRLVIDPNLVSKDVVVSGNFDSTQAKKVKSYFEKHFTNNLEVLQLEHSGYFDSDIGIYIKVDTKDFESVQLYFYSKETNSYRTINSDNIKRTNSGHLYFTVNSGGYIIISENELNRK